MESHYHFDPALSPFDPGAEGYHANNALWLAAASNLAYEAAETIGDTVSRWGFKRFRFLQGSTRIVSSIGFPVDTQAFVCSSPQALLIAFRGTEPLKVKDWLTDVMIRAVPAPVGLGNIHQGFDAAFAAIRPQLAQAVAEQHDGQQPIWITGHSLGGALAVLAAVQLKFQSKLPLQGIYTFGQPRIGDRTFAKFVNKVFDDRMVRFVSDEDIVPQVPAPGMLMHYWLNNPEAHFDSQGNLIMGRSVWARTLALVKGSRQKVAKRGLEALIDHSMDRYIEQVRKRSRSVFEA